MDNGKNLIDYKVIGRTARKRRIAVVSIGELVNPQLKIFIMAGQHGDEKYSRKAAERLISHLIKTKAKEFPKIVLLYCLMQILMVRIKTLVEPPMGLI